MQHSPINVASVSQIWVIRLICRKSNDLSNQILCYIFKSEIKLDRGCKESQLYLFWLFFKVLREDAQKFNGIINSVPILSDDPDHSCSSVCVVQNFEIVTKLYDNSFVLVGNFSEDVFDDDDCLLDNVVDLRRDKFNQALNASVCCLFKLNGDPSDS